jgi:hypothetical protein
MIEEYKTLVVKMNDDATNNATISTNYELLCDVEIVMGLMCVLPMLEIMHNLNKLVQNKYIFILDFISTVKLCQFEIYTMYVILKNNILEINFRHSWIW